MKCVSLELKWKKLMINVVANTVVLVVLIDNRNHNQVKWFHVRIQSYLFNLR